MPTLKPFPSAAAVAAALLVLLVAVPVWAQPSSSPGGSGTSLSGGRGGYLGLNVGRSSYRLPCGPSSLTCDTDDESLNLYAGTLLGSFWGAEVGLLDMGRVERAGGRTRARGLNLSLVARAPVWQSAGVFGKLGTTYGRTDTSVQTGGDIPGGSENGFGLSFGAGISWDFTPRLSAVLEWDSHDFRFAGGGRDPVRSTSLGLQYRY
ncbi:outer membrane beta-barrel protein [Ramlibacter tataouinensis]|uniref:Outer membrane protein A-like protein n=1 Tax=Ramlibacter tataouinensis (strain ATCC BAA-407 / DSM 14655 / LMG 21543 / TTB310) TaxID=365046 RepID=F5XXD3_RAMTT|nr:outer membrane beta-barrel protein [Ramlibacter tataouinensis]AEG94268.1 outer membrane protein A precursor-like protein [Ramlibacter tataouinensis TTB310]